MARDVKGGIAALDVKAAACALGTVGLLSALLAVVIHGFLRVPSIASVLFPWFSFFDAGNVALLAAVLAVSGMFYGALFAWLYNCCVKCCK